MFKFVNCLGRPCDDKIKTVKSIKFNISNYGMYNHTINFIPSVTEKTAIETAEYFLSNEVDEEYFNMIKHDLPIQGQTWEEAKKWFKIKGDALTNVKYLSSIHINMDMITLRSSA